MVEVLAQAIANVLQWHNLIAIMGGTILGIAVGAVPGLQGSMAVAIGLPITFFLPAETGILLLLGVYKGANFGGSIPAVLINTPGTIAAVATTFDGYPLAQQGKGGKALKMALYSSALGDTFSDIVLILVAAQLARIALKFGPFEYFALLIFTFTIIAAVARESMLKGLLSAVFGLCLATIGTDPIHGNPRFTFGISDLRGGIPFVALLIGLYALSQAFLEVEQAASAGMAVKSGYKASPRPEDNRVSFGELRSCAGTIFKSGIMGTVMGALPGIGPAISSFVCYGEAKRTAKNPDEFGKGALRGVAAAEAGNSSVCGANLLPLLTLGIPGDMVAAVLLGAFLINGMQPGPLLFQEHAVTVYSIFMGMILINGFNFLFGRLFIRFFITVTNMSKAILYPIIVVLCVAGIYAYNSDMFDVKVMLVFGVVGYFLRKLGFPLAPMAIAFLLGPMTEEKARQSLILARGDLSQIFYHPIADLFLAVTVITLAWTIRKELKWRRERSISKARIPKEDS